MTEAPIKQGTKHMWWALIVLLLLSLFNLGFVLFTEHGVYPATITERGAQGLQGLQGTQGTQGIQGFTIPGPKGDTGTQGPQGTQGTQGVQGDPGATGAQGETGTQGAQGDPGTNGKQVEFRCDPDNDNYEYRYTGDETWTIIEPNSNTCKSSAL